MNVDGSEKNLEDDYLPATGVANQNQSSSQAQASRKSEVRKTFMESEGRGHPDLYRNTSEEIFLKSLIENSIGTSTPNLEMLGFKNISQTFRVDSEELFNSWLSNGETLGHTSTSIAHRTRQASRRISTELASLSSQQNGNAYQKKSINDNSLQQNLSICDELSNDPNQRSLRNALEKGMQASNLYLAKAWFKSSQPMTRSRSSELRRKYAAMQSFQIPSVMESPLNSSGQVASRMEQDFATTSSFCDTSMDEIPNQLQTFMSPSNSYSSSVCTPPVGTLDSVSSVVSMLKGTLERKKLANQSGKEMVEGGYFGLYGTHEVPAGSDCAMHQIVEPHEIFPALSSVQVKDLGNMHTAEGSLEIDVEGFVGPPKQIQMGVVSQEPSQSESSAAAPLLSAGLEVCDDPNQSGQTVSVCESSRRHVVSENMQNGSKAKGFKDWTFENNVKDDRKKGHLVRMGSLSSRGSVDKEDPTKKRRVERSRKMAEAKERNSTPTIPSDMQSVLKRCENLEKEVRSLKLNLSFMNRKDSEQTKQIEELQKKNEELTDEKERLLEEIERIISDPDKM